MRTRFSERKPQTHTYAPLSPVLHYNEGQGDLVGGNFWDMRATGRRLGNPAAETASGTKATAVETATSDTVCKNSGLHRTRQHDAWWPVAAIPPCCSSFTKGHSLTLYRRRFPTDAPPIENARHDAGSIASCAAFRRHSQLQDAYFAKTGQQFR